MHLLRQHTDNNPINSVRIKRTIISRRQHHKRYLLVRGHQQWTHEQIAHLRRKQWSIVQEMIVHKVVEDDGRHGFTVELGEREVCVHCGSGLRMNGHDNDDIGNVQHPAVAEYIGNGIVLVARNFGKNDCVVAGVVVGQLVHVIVDFTVLGIHVTCESLYKSLAIKDQLPKRRVSVDEHRIEKSQTNFAYRPIFLVGNADVTFRME